MRIRLPLLPLTAVLILPAAAVGAPRSISTEFTTLDLSNLSPADVAAPAGQPAAATDQLSQIDQAYLNRHIGRNLEDSNAALRNLLAAQPRNPDLLWRVARGLHDAGLRQAGRDEKLKSFEEGESLLSAALSQRPKDAVIHYWLARIYGDQNQIKRTLGLAKAMRRELEASIGLDARHADAHHYLGELLRQLPGIFGGDKHKAVAELEEAVRLAPNEASHYSALAEAYLDVKDNPRAIETARKVLAIKASDDPGGYDASAKSARELLQKLGAS